MREIEQNGMPLVSEVGRDGGYAVMPNSLLPAIRFSNSEIKALFTAFIATRNRQLPYLKSRQTITEKLLGLLSPNQQDELVRLNELIRFPSTNHRNPNILDLVDQASPILEKLVNEALLDSYLRISTAQTAYLTYIYQLYQERGSWFVAVINYEQQAQQIISVDEITAVTTFEPKVRWSQKKVESLIHPKQQLENFKLRLGYRAISQFKKYHPFQLMLNYTSPFQTSAIIQGYLDTDDQNQVEEAIKWLLFLGDDVEIETLPDSTREMLKQYLQKIKVD
ncbi:helix-turn-helix transcriptional regulator [Secundilactobacillus oryzae]|uniref:helix-turn-helix transcriptional regulator n=1 Tax=Secundilactobacillus oryzae TaxID=1202668 RepID=UPI000B1AA66C|nr:WYL domain-containing protein [Secundilactobacillus oryzae]